MNAEHEYTPEMHATEELLRQDADRLGEAAGLEGRVYGASLPALRGLKLAGGDADAGASPARRVVLTPLRMAACVALMGVVGAAMLALRGGDSPAEVANAGAATGTPGVDPDIDSLFFVAMHPENQDLRDELRSLRAEAARLGDRLSAPEEPFLGDDEDSM